MIKSIEITKILYMNVRFNLKQLKMKVTFDKRLALKLNYYNIKNLSVTEFLNM